QARLQRLEGEGDGGGPRLGAPAEFAFAPPQPAVQGRGGPLDAPFARGQEEVDAAEVAYPPEEGAFVHGASSEGTGDLPEDRIPPRPALLPTLTRSRHQPKTMD